MMQLALLPTTADLWFEISDKDQRAVAFFDGHYSRQTPGSRQMLAPGFHYALWHEVAVGVALWGVVFARFFGVWRFRNTIFRNKSGTLSSLLIEEATDKTLTWRADRGLEPSIPLRTEIDIAATRARRGKHNEPGHCYLQAGWTKVRDIPAGHGRPAKVELEAPLGHDLPHNPRET